MPFDLTKRSQSQPVYRFGRGGAGNVRPVLGSHGPAASRPGPGGHGPVRTHEVVDRRNEVTTTGRGGAGNIRPPLTDARAGVESAIRIEARYIKDLKSRKGEQIRSTGRGGAGNIFLSRSRPHDQYPSSTRSGCYWNLDSRPPCDPSKLHGLERSNVEREESAQHSASQSNRAAGYAPA